MPNLPYFSTAAEFEEGQGTPWVTMNALAEVLAKKMAALLSVTITASDVTLTAAQAETARYIRVTGALTGNKNLIVPAVAKDWVVEHSGTGNYTVTVKTPSGTGVAINQDTTRQIYCDGTNCVPESDATGAGGDSIILGGTQRGLP